MIHTDIHYEPAESMLVTDIATLRVVSDKLRGQLIDLLRAGPHTVKQLAAALDLRPKQLYYHINLLEKHGLIRVVQTRLISGIVEKTYRATAHIFLFDQDVFAATNQPGTVLNPVLTMMFDTTHSQLEQSIQDELIDTSSSAPPHQSLLAVWNMQRLSAAQAEDFYARLGALLNEFEVLEAADDERHAYRLFVTLFPISSHARPVSKKGNQEE